MPTHPAPKPPGIRLPAGRTPPSGIMSDAGGFAQLDDSALLARRAEMRAELERLPPASPGHAVLTALYDKSTQEVNNRARDAWSRPS